MRGLTPADMLDAWEACLDRSPLERALVLLASLLPEIPADTLPELSIGQRDRLLMELRRYLFGSQLVNTAICPTCGERVEWESRIDDFLASVNEDRKDQAERFSLQNGEYLLSFRLPNSADIAAVMDNTEKAEIQQHLLLARCILDVEHGGEKLPRDKVPDHVFEELAAHISREDPLADIRIELSCPHCSHGWEVLFDIGSFLWQELNSWAEGMLLSIHRLARGYGWSEQEILALSPVRRQLYLGMLGE